MLIAQRTVLEPFSKINTKRQKCQSTATRLRSHSSDFFPQWGESSLSESFCLNHVQLMPFSLTLSTCPNKKAQTIRDGTANAHPLTAQLHIDLSKTACQAKRQGFRTACKLNSALPNTECPLRTCIKQCLPSKASRTAHALDTKH